MRGPGPPPAERGRRLTLAELLRRGRPADPFLDDLTYRDLFHDFGLKQGDRVVVQAEKSPGVVLAYLACARVGAVLVPLNPAYTPEETAYFVDDVEPTVILRDDDLAGAVGGDEYDGPDPAPEDPVAIVYTSGTTGRPKGAVLRQSNLASNADVLARLWGFTRDDVLLHALPVFHVHGLFVAINCVLASGASMVFLPRFDVDAVLAELPRATVYMGVPTHFTRLLEDDRLDHDVCSSMRLFVSGSAPLLASTHDAFRARTGHRILERYGMTETAIISSNPLDGDRRPGTVGFPLPGTEVRLADDEVVEVRGPSVFDGYWRRPDLAATEFTADGWFRTGDVGRFDEDGYLRLVGRAKDLVITGGMNVYPSEVEDVIDAIDGVAESAVIGVPDADFGEAVLAVVVPGPGRIVDPEAVRATARERLAGYKVPKRVEVVDALPRNAMGKVEKTLLRRQFGAG